MGGGGGGGRGACLFYNTSLHVFIVTSDGPSCTVEHTNENYCSLTFFLILLYSEWPKLSGVLAILSTIGLTF